MAPPSPNMSGPNDEPPRDDGRLPEPSADRDAAPASDQEPLLAELRSCVRHEELELRAAVVMFCNNASDSYQSLTPDELDECREVEKVRDYLHEPGFRGIDHLKERFYSARRIIREEADAYLGHPETVDQLVTFFDSHLLAESASCVMSEAIMARIRLMNERIEKEIMQPFLEGINERMAEQEPFSSGLKGRTGADDGSLLSESVEVGRRTLGAVLKEHLGLKVQLDSLIKESMKLFSAYFCSSCHVDDEYLASTEQNLEIAFSKPFNEALVNSYTGRYGQILQTLVGMGAVRTSDKLTPLLEESA